jgi:hypothetical protein
MISYRDDVAAKKSQAARHDGAASSGAAAEGAAAEGAAAEGAVNFDEAALVELEIDGTDYRIDAGRAGTALCISTRPSGSYGWTFRSEARWQAKVLRCKAFDREVLSVLAKALAEAAAAIE